MQTNHIFPVYSFVVLLCCFTGCKSRPPVYERPITTNSIVTIQMVSPNDDTNLPAYKTIYRPLSEFVSTNAVIANVAIDCKLSIENRSEWPFVFASPYSLSGYDCLEVDLMLDDGSMVVMKRRKPSYLADRGEFITILPNKCWEDYVSLDSRLWDVPSSVHEKKIRKIRPRFAYGAFKVNRKYYRFYEEINESSKKEVDWKSRGGELIGDWINYWK